MDIYVTYLISYKGNKLPPFYIGSTNLSKIQSGYMGSVKSKHYKDIWKSELKDNPHLFSIKIISTHSTREEATRKEYRFQSTLNVMKSPLYVNMSMSAPNGYFGRDVSGKNNPNYGKRHTWNEEQRQNHAKKMKLGGNGFYKKTHTNKTKIIIGDKNAKNQYEVFDPNGIKYFTSNLKRFCKENGLTSAGMFATAKGTYPTHKGWYCRKLSTNSILG